MFGYRRYAEKVAAAGSWAGMTRTPQPPQTLEEKVAEKIWAQANPMVAALRQAMQQLEKAIGKSAATLPAVLFLLCCIDSPPFVAITQHPTIEVGDKGITVEQLDKLEPGVVYTITQNGQETTGTVEVGSSESDTGGLAIETGTHYPFQAETQAIEQPSYDPPAMVVSP